MAQWQGLYALADFVRLLREPRETVREWTLKGLAPTRPQGRRVSPSAYDFGDLVSLLVVSKLRARGVPLQRIRTTEEYLREECGLERPLASTRLFTAGKDVLVRLLADDGPDPSLVVASRYGQGAIQEAFDAVLNEVHYQEGLAIAWEPWEDVQVSPRRQFGAPCLRGTGLQTATLYGFVKAGDAPEHVAELYGVSTERVLHAVAWEDSLAAGAKKAA